MMRPFLVALLGLLLAGLMVGRTLQYLGKTIGPTESKMLTLYVLATPLAILPLTALAVATKAGLAGLTTNGGAQGFTEIIFAFAFSLANNGQSFTGLNANTTFYNLTTAVAMMVGRFGLAIPALALAGLFAHNLVATPVRAPSPPIPSFSAPCCWRPRSSFAV